ncbi:uncharacterized protein LOC142765728 isoform X2 [Rhipicephalus microplus]|uniref:uncharacterized protein LOC142765728 isoform X2 n=1 Tax=Rhipicephalus microplus TaxID=6941 RepID=UPI003F6B03ED
MRQLHRRPHGDAMSSEIFPKLGTDFATATASARTTSPKVPSQALPRLTARVDGCSHCCSGSGIFDLRRTLPGRSDGCCGSSPPWPKEHRPHFSRPHHSQLFPLNRRLILVIIPARHRFIPNPQCLDHLAYPGVAVRTSVRRARKRLARKSQLPHYLTEAQGGRCIHRRPQPVTKRLKKDAQMYSNSARKRSQ